MVFDDGDRIDLDGTFDTEDAAWDAGVEASSSYHQGNDYLSMAGEDYSEDDCEIEVYEE